MKKSNMSSWAMKFTILLVFTIGGINPITLYSQQNKDYQQFRDLFAVHEHKHDWGHHLKDSKNELNFIFTMLFLTYKEVFSSQDIDACVFTPSCSVYAIESIKENGAIIGTFDAFDRISRCNPGRSKKIPLDKVTGKFFDPVQGINRKPK